MRISIRPISIEIRGGPAVAAAARCWRAAVRTAGGRRQDAEVATVAAGSRPWRGRRIGGLHAVVEPASGAVTVGGRGSSDDRSRLASVRSPGTARPDDGRCAPTPRPARARAGVAGRRRRRHRVATKSGCCRAARRRVPRWDASVPRGCRCRRGVGGPERGAARTAAPARRVRRWAHAPRSRQVDRAASGRRRRGRIGALPTVGGGRSLASGGADWRQAGRGRGCG